MVVYGKSDCGLKQTQVEQVILSGILPVIGRRGHGYRNCRGMAINVLSEKLCREEEVGFVDLWGSFVGRADMYKKDGLHLSGKGAAVFADGLSAAVDSGMGSISNIFGSKHPQAGQEATSTDKPVTECPKNMSEAGYRYVCLNAWRIVNKKNELNIKDEDIDPHIIGITESWANTELQMLN